MASPVDGGPSDGSSPPPTGCPTYEVIDTQAAVGKACAPDGTYCLDPTCNACTMDCPAVECTHGAWTPAVNTGICSTGDASVDSGARPDGGACKDIDPASFDQTCAQDSDCFEITAGMFCSNTAWCMCGGAAINVDGQSSYEAELEYIQSYLTPGPGGCSCPYFGTPRCVASRCTLCGGASPNVPGCPDGG